MSELRQAIDQYLALRRGLGYTLRGVASGLRSFAGFAAREGATRVTIDLALRWAAQSRGTALATQGSRLQMVRRFAQWRHVTDPRTEVPPHDLLPTRFPRKPPYLYRDTELDQLLKVTRTLPSSTGLRGRTYFTLFGLLMVTGMRVGEAVALDEDDVNLEEVVLFDPPHQIRQIAFGAGASLHGGGLGGLRESQGPTAPPSRLGRLLRDRAWRAREPMDGGLHLREVSGQIGLRPPMHGHSDGHGPRLHDLRHRFAARTLLDWYRAGIDVERAMPRLATYLGHVHVNETYARTRNVRLAAIHAFFRYVSICEPAHADRCHRSDPGQAPPSTTDCLSGPR